MKSPMLAASTNGSNLVYPMLASPKLDGIRALIIGGVVMSRKFKPIPNRQVQALFGHAKYNGLDGELIVGRPTNPECYRNTMSGVMSADGKPEAEFHVFDDFSVYRPFHERLELVFMRATGKQMRFVTHHRVNTEEQLRNYEEQCLMAGYEGVMLRQAGGFYKEGRSTLKEGWLLKLKRFEDSEAEILGFTELMINTNEKTITTGNKAERSHKKAGMVGADLLGALHVRDLKTGVEFDLGSGFTDAQRADYWQALQLGICPRIVKYQYFPLGSKEKPRFPTFLGFRDKIDF
jgi:DNA ligase-1